MLHLFKNVDPSSYCELSYIIVLVVYNKSYLNSMHPSHLSFTYSKSKIETLEKGVKYIQS